ncbi:MAG TPA: hypothetical protein VGQ81_12280 [Acidobacteriota bacterium]|jgi:hypothetical protein|nr:hypothetical protein [Acidobacteriota bacterium]
MISPELLSRFSRLSGEFFRILLVIAASNTLLLAEGPVFHFFGSMGSETHVTPANKQSPLNPSNFLNLQSRSSSSDISLFGELSPEDKSWKFHCKLRGSNEWSRHTTSRADVSELYLNLSVTPWLDFQVGRSIEKWGTGYAWNPTGVLNPRKDPRDPNDRRAAYRGVDAVRADVFARDWNFSFLMAPEIDWTGRHSKRLLSTGWATRAYRLVRGVDLSLSASGGNGLPNSQGISLARVFGNALELHAEAAAFHDTLRYVPTGDGFALQKREHGEVLLGGQYTLPRNINIVVEYFYTGIGLSEKEWQQFGQLVQSGQIRLASGDRRGLLLSNLYFTPLLMGKDYGFMRLYSAFCRNKLEVEAIVISSLRDGSSLVRPGFYWKVHPNWSLYWLQSEFLGDNQTEMGHIQIRRSSDFGVRYHF